MEEKLTIGQIVSRIDQWWEILEKTSYNLLKQNSIVTFWVCRLHEDPKWIPGHMRPDYKPYTANQLKFDPPIPPPTM